MQMHHVHDILPDYVNGKLESPLHREVTGHLEVCPDCRIEAENLVKTLAAIQSANKASAPHGYFTTVLPRVHHRLEQGEKFGWLKNPLVVRFAAPLVAVIIMVVLLNHASFDWQEASNGSLSDVITSDDVADVYVRQTESLPLTDVGVEQLVVATTPEGILERQIAEFFMVNGTGIGFEEYPEASTDLFLESLSEQEIESLLQRLGERTL